jgi:hypothetical protein
MPAPTANPPNHLVKAASLFIHKVEWLLDESQRLKKTKPAPAAQHNKIVGKTLVVTTCGRTPVHQEISRRPAQKTINASVLLDRGARMLARYFSRMSKAALVLMAAS